jgi:hypothetical protein
MVCGGFDCFRIERRDLLWTANVRREAVRDTKEMIVVKEVNIEAQSKAMGSDEDDEIMREDD